MPTTFLFKGIKSPKLQTDAIRLELLNALRKEGRIQVKELDKTTKTWNGEKPKFESLIGLDRKEGASVLTGPTGSDKAINKFLWLDKGTKIRWAVMSGNWKSKTKPGNFRAGAGRGYVVIAGRGAMSKRNIRARPGIKPRGWTEKLQKQRKRPFQKSMVKAMQRGAKKIYK